jgi:hypothetical protein
MVKDNQRATIDNPNPKNEQPTPPPTKRLKPGTQRLREEHNVNARTAKHYTLKTEGGPSDTDPGGI